MPRATLNTRQAGVSAGADNPPTDLFEVNAKYIVRMKFSKIHSTFAVNRYKPCKHIHYSHRCKNSAVLV